MSDPIDLAQAAKNAFYGRLASMGPMLGGVFDAVPQNTKPPYTRLGTFEAQPDDDKDDDQLETISAEVVCVYQGDDRGRLFDMAHAVRLALANKPLAGTGIAFERPRWISTSVSDRLPDGVSFAAIIAFELIAQPAG